VAVILDGLPDTQPANRIKRTSTKEGYVSRLAIGKVKFTK